MWALWFRDARRCSTLATSALAPHKQEPRTCQEYFARSDPLLAVQRHCRLRAQVKLFFTDVGKLPPPVLQFQRVTFGYSPSQVLYQDVRPRMRCIAVGRPVCRVHWWQCTTSQHGSTSQHSKSAQLDGAFELLSNGVQRELSAPCQGSVAMWSIGSAPACADVH